ncbi:MAG: hypothetical protein HYU80_04540 [Candidatus Blackburnbacteria bacterium]|nr:hypothetical protein [Candidatus Blackburnbacteria bacterium]
MIGDVKSRTTVRPGEAIVDVVRFTNTGKWVSHFDTTVVFLDWVLNISGPYSLPEGWWQRGPHEPTAFPMHRLRYEPVGGIPTGAQSEVVFSYRVNDQLGTTLWVPLEVRTMVMMTTDGGRRVLSSHEISSRVVLPNGQQ